MSLVASKEEISTVVTLMSRRAFVPRPAADLDTHIEQALSSVADRYFATNWEWQCSHVPAGWVCSAVVTRATSDGPSVCCVIASHPRESRDVALGEVLGKLFLVGN
jgi:hypothetical protein